MTRIVIWLWVLVIVAAGVYAPWRYDVPTLGIRPAGYYCLFAPPPRVSIQIDVARLTVEWIMATAICGGVYATMRRERD